MSRTKNENIAGKVKNLENIRPKCLMKEIVDGLLDGEEIPETEFLSNVSETDESKTEIVSYTVEEIDEYLDDESVVEDFDRYEAKERERRAKNPEYAKHHQELEELLAFVDEIS